MLDTAGRPLIEGSPESDATLERGGTAMVTPLAFWWPFEKPLSRQ
jgi:hypothetical protein